MGKNADGRFGWSRFKRNKVAPAKAVQVAVAGLRGLVDKQKQAACLKTNDYVFDTSAGLSEKLRLIHVLWGANFEDYMGRRN